MYVVANAWMCASGKNVGLEGKFQSSVHRGFDISIGVSFAFVWLYIQINYLFCVKDMTTEFLDLTNGFEYEILRQPQIEVEV